jgi:uncharacterized caspase-like protein
MAPRSLSILALLAVATQQLPPELVVQRFDAATFSVALMGQGGRWIARVDDARVRILDARNGTVIRAIETAAPSGQMYRLTVAAHPREPLIALFDVAGVLRTIDVATGEERWRVTPCVRSPLGPSDRTSTELHYSSDGASLLLTCATYKWSLSLFRGRYDVAIEASRWKADTGQPLGATMSTAGRVGMMVASAPGSAWSADGRWAHRFVGENQSEVVDADTGASVARLKDRTIVASHSASRRAIVAAGSHTELEFRLVDLESARVLRTWKRGIVNVIGPAFSPDGQRLLAGDPFGGWNVVDARSGAVLLSAPPNLPFGAFWVWSPDGGEVVSSQRARTIVATLGQAGVTHRVLGDDESAFVTVEQARVQMNELLGPGRVITDVNATAPPPAPEVTVSSPGFVRDLQAAAALSGDGRWLAARAADGAIDVWDAATGNRMPFRLPAPPCRTGPLEVRPATATSANEAAWPPIDVRSPGTPFERQASQGADMISAGSVGRFGTSRFMRQSAEALRSGCHVPMQAALLPNWGDEQVPAPDGRRVLVATRKASPDTWPADVPRGQMVMTEECTFRPCRWTVLDRRTSTTVSRLRARGAREAGELPVSRGGLHWTSNGRFIVFAGAPAILGPPAKAARAWDAESGEEIDLGAVPLKVVALLNGGSGILVAPLDRQLGSGLPSDVDVVDLAAPGARVRWPAVSFGLSTMQQLGAAGLTLPVQHAATAGTVALGPSGDGSVWIRDQATGRVLGHLRAMAGGEWLVTTPSGLFDGSPGAWDHIAWRTGGLEVSGPEAFFNEYYEPGLLGSLLAGREVRPVRALGERDRRTPVVTLAVMGADDSGARVRLTVREGRGNASSTGAGVRDLRLFRNGLLVKAWRDELRLDAEGALQVETRVALVDGANTLTAYAYNRDNIRGAAASTEANMARRVKTAVTYVLAIGINRYANAEFDLRYAVADATGFSAELGRRQRELGAAIRIVDLLDREATRANIELALSRLAGAQRGPVPSGAPQALAQLEAAGPEDTVIIYFAGHGMAAGDRFHLIPTDLAYTGPRNGIGQAIDAILARSLSDRDLERALEAVDARHLVLVIDACQSGQALEADDPRQGPMNSRGLAQLAYDKGMAVLTASQSYEAALESTRLGHGFLTYALVDEGLRALGADRSPRDGTLTVDEWFLYAVSRVPQLQAEQPEHAAPQEGRVLRPVAASRQTPRAFTRRDTTLAPLVVARP